MHLLTVSSEINGYEALLLIKGLYNQIIVFLWQLNIWFMLADFEKCCETMQWTLWRKWGGKKCFYP